MAFDRLEALNELSALYKGEAMFRPSASPIWLNCAGAVRLIAHAQREERTSPWAQEGTNAHTLAARCLVGNSDPTDNIGQRWIDSVEGGDFTVTAEMAETVNVYLDEVRSRVLYDAELLVETKLSLAGLDPHDPLFTQNRGTADALILHRPARTIRLLDLKYGKGVAVAATTPQVRDYALMAVATYPIPGGWRQVETVIVQPRAAGDDGGIKSVLWDVGELLEGFFGSVVEAMENALLPDAPLNPGPWCRWCPARAGCPALMHQALGIATDAFAAAPMFTVASPMPAVPTEVAVVPLGEKPSDEVAVNLPHPAGLSPDDIATILERRGIWDAWIKGVEQTAVRMLAVGQRVPGFTLKSRTGIRRWREPAAVPDALRALGLQTGAFYTEPELRSPAQVEKILPKQKRSAIETLTERPLGEPTLVRSDDVGVESSVVPVFGELPVATA